MAREEDREGTTQEVEAGGEGKVHDEGGTAQEVEVGEEGKAHGEGGMVHGVEDGKDSANLLEHARRRARERPG